MHNDKTVCILFFRVLFFSGHKLEKIEIILSSLLSTSDFVFALVFQKYREKGIFHFTLNVPEKTTQLTLIATYEDDDGDTASATAQGIAFFSLQVQPCSYFMYI